MKIEEAFEKRSVPVKEYSQPGEPIALRHAVKNYLGHGAGLAAVIQAVVDGGLVPAGRSTRFRGITGYLFRSEDLRKYRPAPDVAAPPEGFLNYREAAARLGVGTDIIRGLADQGFLTASAGFRNGFARLIPATQVRQFGERYVATSTLAELAQRRSKAGRKNRWAEYGQARETALGKPMRQVRAKSRALGE